MPRDPRSLLWDARSSGKAIERFLAGKTYVKHAQRLQRLAGATDRQCRTQGHAPLRVAAQRLQAMDLLTIEVELGAMR
jgi:hypothetical protein